MNNYYKVCKTREEKNLKKKGQVLLMYLYNIANTKIL